MYAGDPWTDCGGQRFDPPCGGCSRCLLGQGMYGLPDWPAYLRRADEVLAAPRIWEESLTTVSALRPDPDDDTESEGRDG